MQSVIKSILFVVSLGFFTVASAQLPPEIMVDKHLMHAEQLHAAKDYVKAFQCDGKDHRTAKRAQSHIVG